MTVLADTHIALWSVYESGRMTSSMLGVLAMPGLNLLLSHASLWEIAIKHSAGKLPLPGGFRQFAAKLEGLGFNSLAIELAHIRMQNTLPFHHKDPFDRMLVAQALGEDLPVLSVDRKLRDYGVRLLI